MEKKVRPVNQATETGQNSRSIEGRVKAVGKFDKVVKAYIRTNIRFPMAPVVLDTAMGAEVIDEIAHDVFSWEEYGRSQLSKTDLDDAGLAMTKAHIMRGVPLIVEGELKNISPADLQKLRRLARVFLQKGYLKTNPSFYYDQSIGLFIVPRKTFTEGWSNIKKRIVGTAGRFMGIIGEDVKLNSLSDNNILTISRLIDQARFVRPEAYDLLSLLYKSIADLYLQNEGKQLADAQRNELTLDENSDPRFRVTKQYTKIISAVEKELIKKYSSRTLPKGFSPRTLANVINDMTARENLRI